MEGEDGLGEALPETDLELHVAFVFGGLVVQCRTTDKISVLVDAKSRAVVKVITYPSAQQCLQSWFIYKRVF